MSEDRLWKFRRPEWLNSVWARNAGVYAAGGLVRLAYVPHLPFLFSFSSFSEGKGERE